MDGVTFPGVTVALTFGVDDPHQVLKAGGSGALVEQWLDPS